MTRKQPKTNRYVLDASVVKARLKELNTNASAVSLKAGMSATYLSNCLGRGVNLNQPTVMAIARELLITDWESIVLHEQPVAPESELIAYETTTSAERESLRMQS